VPKLLIVDDEPALVEMLQTFLQLNDFETVKAFNGRDGLVLADVERPDLIILDLMLPDIEGYEVCQRIRSYPTGATLPVLILSARADPTSKERAMAAGANAYLVKPVRFAELLSALKRLLAARSVAAKPPQPAPEAPSGADKPPHPVLGGQSGAVKPPQPAPDGPSGADKQPQPVLGGQSGEVKPSQPAFDSQSGAVKLPQPAPEDKKQTG
jgi:DNA-binding response OmpR family regulator